MRVVKKILWALLFLLILLQFVPRDKNNSDQVLSTEITRLYAMPVEIQTILQKACYDCHSNNTNYPWYAAVQPFRLFLDKHIREGKDDLNFSEFGSYSKRKQINKMKSIEESITKKTMPLKSYLVLHTEARLTNTERNQLKEWIRKVRDEIK